MSHPVRNRALALERRLLLSRGERFLRSVWLRRLIAARLHRRGFRTLATTPADAVVTPSAVRVNAALEAIGGHRYLEIGIESGLTLEAVLAEGIVGVDPAHRINIARLPGQMSVHTVASDDYFAAVLKPLARAEMPADLFDVVFVDGLHTFEQSYRDVLNAFAILSPTGIVIVDDTVPTNRYAALPDRRHAKQLRKAHGIQNTDWMGDVFRTVLAVRRFHPSVSVATVVDEQHRGQSIMWMTPDADGRIPQLVPASRAELGELHEMDFDGVFAAGVPAEFNPSSLAEAIEARMRSIG